MFMVNFGSTLDGLGEPDLEGEVETVVESVTSFIVMFVVIGALSGISGFVMVSLWTIAGESQVKDFPMLNGARVDLVSTEPRNYRGDLGELMLLRVREDLAQTRCQTQARPSLI